MSMSQTPKIGRRAVSNDIHTVQRSRDGTYLLHCEKNPGRKRLKRLIIQIVPSSGFSILI
jgi:hypothetical protein